jgi:hypothetical protein
VQRAPSDADSIAPLINNSGELTVLVDDVITLLKYPFPTFDPFVRGAGRESRRRAMSERIETPLLSIEKILARAAIGSLFMPNMMARRRLDPRKVGAD